MPKGIDESTAPSISNLSGFWAHNSLNPSPMLPSPINSNPKTGINNPPTNKPIAFTKSETATAFNPPKMAYTIPIRPINQTQIQITACSEIPKTSGRSNIVLKASEPEYKIVGSNIIP